MAYNLTSLLPIALLATAIVGVLIPVFALVIKRSRRTKRLEGQLPEAIDVMVRSLRAGHPLPVAIAMVAREMPDPIGSEFGMASDEMTYGMDLETAMSNMRIRAGQSDLAMLVVAVSIQAKTGGNLAEILGNLSRMVRERARCDERFTLSAEGRFSRHCAQRDSLDGLWHRNAHRAILLQRRPRRRTVHARGLPRLQLVAMRARHYASHGQLPDLSRGSPAPCGPSPLEPLHIGTVVSLAVFLLLLITARMLNAREVVRRRAPAGGSRVGVTMSAGLRGSETAMSHACWQGWNRYWSRADARPCRRSASNLCKLDSFPPRQ